MVSLYGSQTAGKWPIIYNFYYIIFIVPFALSAMVLFVKSLMPKTSDRIYGFVIFNPKECKNMAESNYLWVFLPR